MRDPDAREREVAMKLTALYARCEQPEHQARRATIAATVTSVLAVALLGLHLLSRSEIRTESLVIVNMDGRAVASLVERSSSGRPWINANHGTRARSRSHVECR